ncbi:MAG: hypothetical protein F7B17_09295 [Desulfurococcales archaeon]|nr:hypothetical protein [Desulfurococcales archaeon]
MRYREIKGLGGDEVYKYTSSLSHDARISRFIAAVVKAHLGELARLGYIADVDVKTLTEAVERVSCNPPNEGYEDLWEAIEEAMLEASPQGAWFPLGRSRNDHVAAALRLYIAYTASNLALKLAEASRSFLSTATWDPMPGFTHGEVAYVLSWACITLAYSESLLEAAETLLYSAGLALSKSPLGAAAGAGSLAPINEEKIASHLGFKGVYASPYYAVASRAFLTLASSALGVACTEMSRIAEDLIQLHELRLIGLPSSHLATSSFMPHKENPVTLEILRATASECIVKSITPHVITGKLRYSYNLDLQEANRAYSEVLDAALKAAEILVSLASSIKPRRSRSLKILEEAKPYSAEEAERLSLEEGMPFRNAYSKIASQGIVSLWSPEKVFKARATGCSRRRIESKLVELEEHAEEVENKARAVTSTIEKLLPACRS